MTWLLQAYKRPCSEQGLFLSITQQSVLEGRALLYIGEDRHLYIPNPYTEMFSSLFFGWTVPLRAFAATINLSFSIKAGHVCGDNIDLVDGRPTGSVRVSFGYMSTFEDCQRFLNFVAECFVEKPVTVDQERLEKLKAATASCQEKNEDPPIKITNGEIHEVNEEEQRPKGTSLIETDRWESNSHGGDYILTNIYIYPIKSCGAYEVRPFPQPWAHLFPFSIHSFFLSWFDSVLCSSCRSTTGRWDLWVYCTTEAGWWWMKTVCVWVKRECRVCALFAHRSTCPRTNCFCGHQVRQCWRLTEKISCFALKNSNVWNVCVWGLILSPMQEWIPFQFPWKTTLKNTRAIKCVRAKFAVTGEPAVLKHWKGSSSRKYSDTYHLSHIVLSYQCRLSLLYSWCNLAAVDGVVRPPVLHFISAKKKKKKNELKMMWISSHACVANHRLKKHFIPWLLD